jgi:hypothetical protein
MDALFSKKKYLNSFFIICFFLLKKKKRRVAGIEPASLAWKAKGYSRRFLLFVIASISKPNMKF